MFTLFIILNIVPSLTFFYCKFMDCYNYMPNNSTLNDFIHNFNFANLIISILLFTIPFINYILILAYICSDECEIDYIKHPFKYIKIEENRFIKNIIDFFKEFILALKLLIIWLFKLDFFYKIYKKIINIKLK